MVIYSIKEPQGLVVTWTLVTLGMATSVIMRQEPECRELGVRRSRVGEVGSLGHSSEEVGSEREGVLLGWGTALVRMQSEAEGKGVLGAVHMLGVHMAFVAQSSFHVYSTFFLFTKSCQLMVAVPPLSNH